MPRGRTIRADHPAPRRIEPITPVIETLRRVPLFHDLSDRELASTVANSTVSRYEAGQLVFCGGDLLIVEQGAVRTVKLAANGRQQLIAIERAGSSLGEVSTFAGGPYSTSAIAVTPTVPLRPRGHRSRSLCLSEPQLALYEIRR